MKMKLYALEAANPCKRPSILLEAQEGTEAIQARMGHAHAGGCRLRLRLEAGHAS